jgi:hypothetical protein
VDDPYFKKDSPNSVGVPCTANTSSLVEPTLKYPDISVGRGAILDWPEFLRDWVCVQFCGHMFGETVGP